LETVNKQQQPAANSRSAKMLLKRSVRRPTRVF